LPSIRWAHCVLLITGFGSQEEHAAVVARVREQLPPLFDLVTPMPFVELQKLIDEANALGLFVYDKALYLGELSEGAIAVVAEHLPRKTSPLSQLLFYRLDGAYSEVGEDQTVRRWSLAALQRLHPRSRRYLRQASA
jgi:hypothetical protein